MSVWNRIFAAITAISAGYASVAMAGTCNTLPGWSSGNPMGAAVYGHAVTSAGGFIYSASGASTPPPGAGDVSLFQRYDPASGAWSTLAPVPTPVAGATLAYYAAGGQLFLFGGVASSGFTNVVQVYTITTNVWTTSPFPMPGPRAAMGAGVIGSLIYLAGGFSANGVIENQNWEFNPATGTYTPRATVLSLVARPGSAVSEGRLYVISGVDVTGNLVNTNYRYTPPPADIWDTRAVIPTPVAAPGATALGAVDNCNGDIIVAGGGTPFLTEGWVQKTPSEPESTNITQLYDVTLNSWTAGPPLATARFSLRAAQAGDTLLAFGGWNGSSNVTTVDRIQGLPLPVQLQSFCVE